VSEEERFLGKSVENTLRSKIHEICDGECRKLALEILEAYVYRGERGVKEVLERVIEGGSSGDTAEGSEG